MHPGQDGVKRLCAARETTICSIFFLTGAWEVVILSERAARARAKDLLLRDVSDGPPRAARARAKDLLSRSLTGDSSVFPESRSFASAALRMTGSLASC